MLPKVSVSGARPLPRAYAAMRAYLSGVGDAFRQDSFIVFMNAIQERLTFDIDELWLLQTSITASAHAALDPDWQRIETMPWIERGCRDYRMN